MQKVNENGLFNNTGESICLNKVMEEVANHKGNVWTPIISLKREDAKRLGYENLNAWKRLLTNQCFEIAKGLKIQYEDFVWYAAFHDEGHHPHVHMVCYSKKNIKNGYLNQTGIRHIKSNLMKEIFKQDLSKLYEMQSKARDNLRAKAKEEFENLLPQIKKWKH